METRRLLSGVLTFDMAAAETYAENGIGQIVWNTSYAEWTTSGTTGDVPWTNSTTNPEQAVFPAGTLGTTVVICNSDFSSPVQPMDVSSITFESGGYAIAGGPITLPAAGGMFSSVTGTWGEIDSDISGGPLTVGGSGNGNGTIILTGSNTYSSGASTVASTIVNAGTLQVGVTGSGHSLGTGLVDLASGTQLSFDTGAPVTFTNNIFLESASTSVGVQTINVLGSPTTLSGNISGPGSAIFLGQPQGNSPDATPAITLGGSNSYTGNTTVASGSLNVSGSGSIASSTVVVDSDASLETGANTFETTATVDDDGAVSYADPTPDLVNPVNPVQIYGNGTLTVYGGALNITGTNGFNGSTVVSYGTLSLQNHADAGLGLGSVTVGAGSTLNGTGGTQGNVTVDSGGTLTAGTNAPLVPLQLGDPDIGILDTGNVTLTDGSTFAATVNSPMTAGSGFDQLQVTGNLTITGNSTLTVTGSLNAAIGSTVSLIQTTSGISGNFANVANNSQITVGDDVCTVTYTADDLNLTVASVLPTLSVWPEEQPIVGQPANFQLKAVGPLAASITGWTVNFGDGTQQPFTEPPAIAAGGVYIWNVQHIFSTAGNYTFQAYTSLTTSVVAQVSFTVASTSGSSDSITVTGASPESSTQVNVTWDPILSGGDTFDSFEIAAENTSATPLDYSVVAATTGSADSALVSGLLPSTTYDFLVYGVQSGGSLCSFNSMTATTASPLSISTTDLPDGSVVIYSVSDSLSSVDGQSVPVEDQWQGFDDDGNPVGSPYTGQDPSTFSPTQILGSATVVVTAADAPAGAFDSMTYYSVVPTIVVTGTSGSDYFTVSNNNGAGPYTITGSVTAIPPFYAPNGIDLQVQGRGGVDLLTVNNGAVVTLSTDPTIDGTQLQTAVAVGGTLHPYQGLGPPNNVGQAGLSLPDPLSPTDAVTPTAGDTFNPPLSGTTGPDEITQATATAEPGDVIALTAANVIADSPSGGIGLANTQFWVYGQTTSGNTDWDLASIISTAPAGTSDGNALTAVSIQLPDTLPANSVYLLYELNTGSSTSPGYGYSQPYVINQPQIWWTDQNNSYAGGKVSLFGTNLSYGVDPSPYSDQTWVYLFPENSSDVVDGSPILLHATAVAPDPVTGDGAMDVNPYKVDIDLPSSVVAGNYAVEVYNGHGGVSGLSNAAQITVAPPIVSATFTLLQAFTNAGYSGSIWLNESEDLLDPDAVNDAIVWASSAAQSSDYGGPYTYVTIQLPAGMVVVTAETGPILLQKYVHLVGAGDTGNPATGTVMEAATGADLQSVVRLPYDPGPNSDGIPTPWDIGISNMSLDANGGLVPQIEDPGYTNEPFVSAVIYTVNTIAGVTVQGVTIDATNENPASPTLLTNPVWDILFSTSSTNLQFLDSTFIGPGVGVTTSYSVFDNCHFIACGEVGAQISLSGSTQVIVTRCTDTSLVNNIISPGGNVEDDSGARLVAVFGAQPDLYFGDNTTSDLYYVNPEDSGHGLNGGDQISVEAYLHNDSSGFYATNFSVTVYQNTLAGDGAESFLANGSGVLVEGGPNVVIADNDISNENAGIADWNPGNYPTIQPFQMIVDNSLHNVYVGIGVSINNDTGTQDAVPFDIGNSYVGNIIACVKGGPTQWSTNSVGIGISPYVQDTTPPSIVMNIFYDDIVTGANVGFSIGQGNGQVNGVTVIAGCFLSSDGSFNSVGDYVYSNEKDPELLPGDTFDGFWS